MPYLSVNKNGDELISPDIPFRDYPGKDEWNCYTECDYSEDYIFKSIILPMGTIKKIVNKELTWDDEPIEI